MSGPMQARVSSLATISRRMYISPSRSAQQFHLSRALRTATIISPRTSFRHHAIRNASTFTYATPQDSHKAITNTAVPQSSNETAVPLSTSSEVSLAAPTSSAVPSVKSDDFIPTDLHEGLPEETLKVEERIGFLRELGLDYGWGPTSSVQWLLEHVYIYTGLPWWQCILLTGLTVRLALFKFGMDASDTGGRLAALKPVTDPLVKRMQQARAAGDRNKIMEASQERKLVMKSAGIKMSRTILPVLVQIPLGFGTFRLLRGMSSLPVPGFEDGGTLWFSDLSQRDPTFVLALASSGILYYTFRKTMKSGSAAMFSPSTMQLMSVGLASISGIFSCFLPAALQLSILLTSVFSLAQSVLFRQTWFREMFNMHPMPSVQQASETSTETSPPAIATESAAPGRRVPGNVVASSYLAQTNNAAGSPSSNSSFRSRWQQAVKDMRAKTSEIRGQDPNQVPHTPRRTEGEIRRAQEYEQRRQKELAARRNPSRRR